MAGIQNLATKAAHRNTEVVLNVAANKMAIEIDVEIATAFKAGFEHAVEGGREAGRRLPQMKDAMPVVMYFITAQDRQEFIEAVMVAKPHMAEFKIPEAT